MRVLGIETSCDETAAAVLSLDDAGRGVILANEVLSQLDDHRPYGGIVPEVAARAHLDHADHIVAQALAKADVTLDDIDAVAATAGPGLIGGVLVGVMTAKAICTAKNLPFLAINHLEGHALTARLTDDIAFPYLLLLVSGGHCQLLSVEGVGHYTRLGTTIDDAVGEAFDKTAKMLGLGYPGGPQVEARARTGDPQRFALPRPLKGRAGCDFSFSGLKTKIRQTIESLPPGPLLDQDIDDLCASFQQAVGDVLSDRTRHALEIFSARHGDANTLVVAGGVAANQALRGRLSETAASFGYDLAAPPLALCTDNGAMIAWAGIERFRLGETDPLDFKPRPRWPLDPNAPPALGAGAKA